MTQIPAHITSATYSFDFLVLKIDGYIWKILKSHLKHASEMELCANSILPVTAYSIIICLLIMIYGFLLKSIKEVLAWIVTH